MTEMVNGAAENNYSSQVPVTPSSQPALSQVTSEERTFKQSEVNDLVGRARHEAVERFKRDASMASREQAPQTQPYAAPAHPQQSIPQQPQFNGMSEAEFRRMAAEEAQRLRNEWVEDSQRNAMEQNAQRMATEFFTKLDAGKGKYNDFDTVVKDVDFGAIPHIVQLANMVENTADVMYELARNPAKIASIQQLVSISPKLALSEMKRLASSITTNEQAENFKAPNDPLSQIRPSNAGTDNKGALGVRDYRKKYKV